MSLRRPRVSGRSDASEIQTGCRRFQKDVKFHPLNAPAIHFTHDDCLADIEYRGEGNTEVAMNELFRLFVGFYMGGTAVEIVATTTKSRIKLG